jgi:putative ABC transport system permease protein
MSIFMIFLLVLLVLFLVMFSTLMTSDKGRRSFVLALRSLWLHKLRSFLSVLGIIIGTGAVITLMAFGEGSMQEAIADIERMGATNIIIRSMKPPENASSGRQQRIPIYGLTWYDYERMSLLPTAIRLVPMRVFPQEVKYLNRKFSGRMVGTTPEYQQVNQLEMASGRFLTADDDHWVLNVCVIGSKMADELFPFEDPIDKSIQVGSHIYKIVGVIKERMPTGGTGGSQAAEDFNSDVYLPLKTCNARYGARFINRKPGNFQAEIVEVSQVTMTVKDMQSVRSTGDAIRQLLEDSTLHPRRDDWALTIPLDRLEEAERAKDRGLVLLFFIALISLGVGGIGIMNIMLATVTERTREIGIRRALGAKRRDITLQFLIEAVVQTAVGGAVGVIIGLTMVVVAPPVWSKMHDWGIVDKSHLPVQVNMISILLSVVVAVIVGVGFGLYPARRAALLDPIEALRHE